MQVEGVSTDAVGVSPEFDGYACWRYHKLNVQVFMHPALYRATVNAALVAGAAKKPSEIGGVLLGRIISGTSVQSIVIGEVTGVDSDGPFFNTTARNLEALQVAVRNTPENALLRPIGYFRSHLRGRSTLSPQDHALFERAISPVATTFLVMRPEGKLSCSPRFYFWRDGRLQAEPDESFHAVEVISDDESGAEAAPAKKPQQSSRVSEKELTGYQPLVPERVENVPSDLPEHHDRTEGSIWTRGHLLATSLLVIACVAGFAARPLIQNYIHDTVARHETTTLIGLHAERGPGGALSLNWNRDLPGLAPTQTANLSIVDGPFRRNVSIDAEQLRSGRLTYFAQTDDVQFHFEIDLGDDRSLTESLHVVAPGYARYSSGSRLPTDFSSNMQMLPREGAGLDSIERGASTSLKGIGITETSDGTASKNGAPPPIEPIGNADGEKRFQAPTVASAGASIPTPVLEDVKRPVIAWDGTSQTPKLQNSLPAEPPPETKPIPSTAPHTPATNLPSAPRTVSEISETPPQPVREVLPDARLFGRSLIREAATLQVAVVIDRRGRVTSAHALNPKDVGSFLAAQAISAATQWTFKPARQGDKNVSSTYTILFRFHP